MRCVHRLLADVFENESNGAMSSNCTSNWGGNPPLFFGADSGTTKAQLLCLLHARMQHLHVKGITFNDVATSDKPMTTIQPTALFNVA